MIPLPDKSEIRLDPLPGSGTRPVKWELVDPHLRLIRGRGGMSALSETLGISRKTLWMRRKALGLPPLVTGRKAAHSKSLTKTEAEIMDQVGQGKSPAEIARERGVTRQAVHGAITRAAAKGRTVDDRCPSCAGTGFVKCNKCSGTAPLDLRDENEPPRDRHSDGPHSHVCAACGGSGERQP